MRRRTAAALTAGAVGLVTVVGFSSPAATQPTPPELVLRASIPTGGPGGSEIPAYDSRTKRIFVTNGITNDISVIDATNPTTVATTIELGDDVTVQSVAVRRGLGVAVVAPTNVVSAPGTAVLFDTASLAVLKRVEVGYLPDMVTFDPPGRRILVANEGEPRCIVGADPNAPTTNPAEATNPEGSVTIIDVSRGAAAATATQVGFTGFSTAELRAQGVRVGVWPGATAAQDLEPEYITTGGRFAYVTLQENNALARIDMKTAKVDWVRSLGLKDHSLVGNELDASDRPTTPPNGVFDPSTRPVVGMYMPDAVADVEIDGASYLVTANEGDAREYVNRLDNNPDASGALSCFIDEIRLRDLGTAVSPAIAAVRDNNIAGRLKVTTQFPSVQAGSTWVTLASYGARSMSVWSTDGALVADTGSLIERAVYEGVGASSLAWRSQGIGQTASPDSRSDDKGPEPEGLVIGEAYGRTLAFVGLERAGGIMVFDLAVPTKPKLLQWARSSDLSPEGLVFVAADDSPTGKPLVIVSYEAASGFDSSTAIWELRG
jgi:DNA-binding beta-propeller fold protein YncE